MRVNFEHKEVTQKHGLIRKTVTTYYSVICTITPTEEERAIIRDRGLLDYEFFKQPHGADLQDEMKRHPDRAKYITKDHESFSLRSFVVDGKGKPSTGPVRMSRACRTPSEAKNYEYELTEALKQLKEYIDDNKEVAAKISTFEL